MVFVESKNVRVVDGIIYSSAPCDRWTYMYMIVVYCQCPLMSSYSDFTLNDPLRIGPIEVG